MKCILYAPSESLAKTRTKELQAEGHEILATARTHDRLKDLIAEFEAFAVVVVSLAAIIHAVQDARPISFNYSPMKVMMRLRRRTSGGGARLVQARRAERPTDLSRTFRLFALHDGNPIGFGRPARFLAGRDLHQFLPGSPRPCQTRNYRCWCFLSGFNWAWSKSTILRTIIWDRPVLAKPLGGHRFAAN